jgi:lysine 2,3-aminomutase
MSFENAMHPEKITPFYRSLFNRPDRPEPSDPLARMVRLSPEERIAAAGECADPIGDAAHACAAGGRLIHRYPDRALLLVTGRCPAHCRFCFRRARKDALADDLDDAGLADTLAYLSSHPAVREVILSGGDPLSLAPPRLTAIVDAIRSLPGRPRIRIHTRYPVYDPERYEDWASLAGRVDAWVFHVNHVREITPGFRRAASCLGQRAVLLSQSVLLKGVNDSVAELLALMLGLIDSGITPYYLHVLDRAPGTGHFHVPLEKAVALIQALRRELGRRPCPRLMLDLPGGHGKIELDAHPLRPNARGAYEFLSPITGTWIVYPP